MCCILIHLLHRPPQILLFPVKLEEELWLEAELLVTLKVKAPLLSNLSFKTSPNAVAGVRGPACLPISGSLSQSCNTDKQHSEIIRAVLVYPFEQISSIC